MLDWTTERRRLAMLAALGPARMRGTRTFQSTLNPVDELVFDEIRRRREDPHLDERDDILSMLVQARYEDGAAMTEQELRDELMTLLVAGHETTATSLAWALERLMRHPPMIDRLRDELAAGEDEYLDAVIKETLRLRPVLPIVVRMLTEPTEIGGRLLPARVAVAPCIYLMHRRADVYPEPERFRPERFLESPAGTYTWIPFGGGVRRCLGASFAIFEMKTVLSEIISRVELSPSETESEPVVRRAITLTPGRGAGAIVAERAAAVAANGASAAGEPEAARAPTPA
jgi:cytochrome P450